MNNTDIELIETKINNELSNLIKNMETEEQSKKKFEKYGSFGKVTYDPKLRCCIKEVNIFDEYNELVANNIREICFLSQFNCSGITKIHGLSVRNEKLNVYMDYHGWSLWNIDINNNTLMLNVIFQLLSILKNLEELHIIHGDIKPYNIVYTGNKVTLIDWGSVCFNYNHKKINLLGTYEYASPESHYLTDKFISHINDVWSLGVSLLSVYNKRVYQTDFIKLWIKNGQSFIDNEMKTIKDRYIYYLIYNMINLDHKARLPASKLINCNIFDRYRHINIKMYRNVHKLNEIKKPHPLRSIMFKYLIYFCKEMEDKLQVRLKNCFVLACIIYDRYYNIKKSPTCYLDCITCLYISHMLSVDDWYSLKMYLDSLLVYISNSFLKTFVDLEKSLLIRTLQDQKEVFNNIRIILTSLNCNVYEKTFDLDYYKPDYSVILKIITNNPGLSNDEYYKLYLNYYEI